MSEAVFDLGTQLLMLPLIKLKEKSIVQLWHQVERLAFLLHLKAENLQKHSSYFTLQKLILILKK